MRVLGSPKKNSTISANTKTKVFCGVSYENDLTASIADIATHIDDNAKRGQVTFETKHAAYSGYWRIGSESATHNIAGSAELKATGIEYYGVKMQHAHLTTDLMSQIDEVESSIRMFE